MIKPKLRYVPSEEEMRVLMCKALNDSVTIRMAKEQYQRDMMKL